MAYKRPSRPRLKPVPRNCTFCKEKREPSYRNVEELKRYVSDRAKILSHLRTGICSRHQRHIAVAVKHARYLALLPFITRA